MKTTNDKNRSSSEINPVSWDEPPTFQQAYEYWMSRHSDEHDEWKTAIEYIRGPCGVGEIRDIFDADVYGAVHQCAFATNADGTLLTDREAESIDRRVRRFLWWIVDEFGLDGDAIQDVASVTRHRERDPTLGIDLDPAVRILTRRTREPELGERFFTVVVEQFMDNWMCDVPEAAVASFPKYSQAVGFCLVSLAIDAGFCARHETGALRWPTFLNWALTALTETDERFSTTKFLEGCVMALEVCEKNAKNVGLEARRQHAKSLASRLKKCVSAEGLAAGGEDGSPVVSVLEAVYRHLSVLGVEDGRFTALVTNRP